MSFFHDSSNLSNIPIYYLLNISTHITTQGYTVQITIENTYYKLRKYIYVYKIIIIDKFTYVKKNLQF